MTERQNDRMTEQNLNVKPDGLADSIILVFKEKIQLEVIGGAKDVARFRRPWGHKAKERNGADIREVWFRGRDILFIELVTAEEKMRKAAEGDVHEDDFGMEGKNVDGRKLRNVPGQDDR